MQQNIELPEGWISAKFEEIIQNFDGKRVPLKSSDRKKRQGQYPYYGASGIIDYIDDYIFDGEFLLISEDGANLVARNTPIAFIAKGRFWVNNHAHIVKTYSNIPLGYLSFFFNSTDLLPFITGSAQPKLTQGNLNNIEILLPPLPEQHRIVSAIGALFACLDATNEKLDRVPEILKRFRQSVLAASCNGRLTEAWREEYKQNLECKHDLECIDFLNNLIENFDAYVPSDYDPIIPQSIPEEWELSRCHNLCDNNRAVTYGVIKLGQPVEDGIPTLRSSDVRWLKIDKNHVKCISPEIASNYSRTFLKGGEILVTVRGTLGGVAVVPQDMAGFNISREVAVIPLINGLNSHFFSYAIASKWSQNWLSEMTKGVAYTGINIKDLKNLPLPVPPIPEQKEIVRRVDALFAFADSIEAKVKTAREKTEKLKQSILAKAFSGELVPTEAEIARREGRDYETAEFLLERIKKERGKSGKNQ
ncbi:restriction endonuclease subunit S [Methanosarcina sp. Z-7115]|uniref:Restriction endonuclease subunit S n=1 Tax=Methanosarcina baikalica TaxID=3073890 RepID=A0ABU2D3T2_9EURY|nr:restriction endonuclease subunit S [Methanosarcina sp. Z-7115]MDR7666643.1 restriction endonuclease subunit S [Methanosarcina sp. Z-7115]